MPPEAVWVDRREERDWQDFLRVGAHWWVRAGYHRWLTPEVFGKRFGGGNLHIVVVWLAGVGMGLGAEVIGRIAVEVSGTRRRAREASGMDTHRDRGGTDDSSPIKRPSHPPVALLLCVLDFADAQRGLGARSPSRADGVDERRTR